MRKDVKLLDSGCSSMGGPEGGQSAQAAEQDAGATATGHVGLAGMSGSGSPAAAAHHPTVARHQRRTAGSLLCHPRCHIGHSHYSR